VLDPLNSALKRKRVGAFNYSIEFSPAHRGCVLSDWQSLLDFTIRFGRSAGPCFHWQADPYGPYDHDQDQCPAHKGLTVFNGYVTRRLPLITVLPHAGPPGRPCCLLGLRRCRCGGGLCGISFLGGKLARERLGPV
jgi:hypothetical protein